MEKPKKINNQLSISQKKELEEWEKKIDSGEAYKIAENELMNNVSSNYDFQQGIRKFAEVIFPKLAIKREKLTKEEQEEFRNISLCCGLDNGFGIMGAVEVDNRGLIQTLRKKLIKEFDCKSYSEKALVDLAVNAYSRNLTFSTSLITSNKMGYTTQLLNNYLSIASKEIDRANRQFITALETLRQLKQPELKVNVKTKNAFIAQNQQFNNNQNETNNSK
ncbi:MAG: hypothetical protein PHW95_02580 [Patescibacteria group bacterium]|nr:hypothetical protein [Patescibacteria group bacterium]